MGLIFQYDTNFYMKDNAARINVTNYHTKLKEWYWNNIWVNICAKQCITLDTGYTSMCRTDNAMKTFFMQIYFYV